MKVLFWIWGKLLREEIVLSCFRAKIHIDLRWKVNRVFWYMHCFSVQCNEIQLLFCAFLSLSLMCDGRTPSSIPISILLKQGTTHPNPNFISLSGLRTHQSLDSSNKNPDAQVLKGGLSQPQNRIGWWQIASRFSIDVLFSSTSSCVTLTLTQPENGLKMQLKLGIRLLVYFPRSPSRFILIIRAQAQTQAWQSEFYPGSM